MSEYTQGVCQDGAAILKDGVPMTPEEIIKELRYGENHAAGFNYMAGALEQLEQIVGINTGGANGPGPVLSAVEQIIKERDALAAHVERLRKALSAMTKWQSHVDPEERAHALRVLADTPTTSLARLKAQWQAEALDALADRSAGNREVYDACKRAAEELRRQAEGGDHD